MIEKVNRIVVIVLVVVSAYLLWGNYSDTGDRELKEALSRAEARANKLETRIETLESGLSRASREVNLIRKEVAEYREVAQRLRDRSSEGEARIERILRSLERGEQIINGLQERNN